MGSHPFSWRTCLPLQEKRWLDQMETEHENVRAELGWCQLVSVPLHSASRIAHWMPPRRCLWKRSSVHVGIPWPSAVWKTRPAQFLGRELLEYLSHALLRRGEQLHQSLAGRRLLDRGSL